MPYQKKNPFTPGFGEIPYIVAGRSDITDEYEDIIESGGRSQKRHPLIKGMRSYGKTVLLRKLLKIAEEHGYETFYISSTSDMYGNLMTNISEKAAAINVSSTFSFAPSVTFSDENTGTSTTLGGISISRTSEHEPIDRTLESLIRVMLRSKKIKGIAVAIDEINPECIDDIQRIAATMQSLVSEKLPVSFICAGLPEYIDEIQQDPSISFIRRMSHKEIGAISFEELGKAIKRTCTDHGIDISDEAIEYIVRASDGSPYLVQMFSSVAYEHASETKSKKIEITANDCLESFKSALPTILTSVVKPTFQSLTYAEQEFLRAMAQDDKVSTVSRIGAIAERMGKTPQYANIYKNRLIDKRIIKQDGRGFVRCSIPYMTTYLSNQEHYDSLCAPSDGTDFENRPGFWLDIV